MRQAPSQREHGEGRSLLALWAGWFLGPLAWALHETISYLLIWPVCAGWDRVALDLAAAATLLLALAGIAIGFREWRREEPGESARVAGRSRFLALGGMVLSAISLLGILVESVPLLVLDPCAGIP